MGRRKWKEAAFAKLDLRVASTLEDQIQTLYIPRVFTNAMPWCAGGPYFSKRPRPRRGGDRDSTDLPTDTFLRMTAGGIEAQFQTAWGFHPAVSGLAFASIKSISLRQWRCRRPSARVALTRPLRTSRRARPQRRFTKKIITVTQRRRQCSGNRGAYRQAGSLRQPHTCGAVHRQEFPFHFEQDPWGAPDTASNAVSGV